MSSERSGVASLLEFFCLLTYCGAVLPVLFLFYFWFSSSLRLVVTSKRPSEQQLSTSLLLRCDFVIVVEISIVNSLVLSSSLTLCRLEPQRHASLSFGFGVSEEPIAAWRRFELSGRRRWQQSTTVLEWNYFQRRCGAAMARSCCGVTGVRHEALLHGLRWCRQLSFRLSSLLNPALFFLDLCDCEEARAWVVSWLVGSHP